MACTVIAALTLSACADTRTADAKLEELFGRRQAELAMLTAMVQQDGLSAVERSQIGTRNFRCSVEDGKFTGTAPPPVTVARLADYLGLLKAIGVNVAVYTDDSRVYFKYDRESLFNGDSHKGFLYSPETLPETTSTLDNIRKPAAMGSERYFLYRSLPKPGWFLYLCIN
jgi:hypothetical protein